tara:strand:+ start:1711 stop:3003 length:1293 start_codon:yes stop_codon:yes gene_type:complete
MAKPRYRTQRIIKSVQEKPLVPGTDYVGQRDATLLKPDNGAISLVTVQDDYYPWDAGAHIISEDIGTFEINTELDYLETAADKTHRDPNGNIISQINSDAIGQDFVIVPQRYVLARDQYLDIIDTSITELLPAVIYSPTGPPILRSNPNSGETTGIIIFPSHGTIDGKISDDYSIFDDPGLSTTVYQFRGNNSRVLVADAYNYLAEDDIEIEDGLTYEWIFNSDNPAKHGLETRKKISNKVVSRTKKLAIINGTIFDTGYYICRIKNERGTIETPSIYLLCTGGLIIERDEIRNPETSEFIGYGAATGEIIEDQQHNNANPLTEGWMDFNEENNEWFRTAWDNIIEEWYSRDSYRGFNTWRVPKYGPEPKNNDVSDERVSKPTKTQAVSQTPESPPPARKQQQIVRPQQQVVRNTLPSKRLGRNSRIQES